VRPPSAASTAKFTWPFLLIFTALITLEWWLRKRHGWV
jgi:hypothetical protein